ncbi:MAG TPA: hypothetical protein VJ873_06600 [bacterium]|nr:hypothetical protein [bacterium]
MGRLMQILGIILALALIYAVLAGLGLTHGLKGRKNVAKMQVITDFEDTNDDFDWTTGGYVKIEPSTENKTHGKYCAKATFLLAGQFLPNATPVYPATPIAGSPGFAQATPMPQAATSATPQATNTAPEPTPTPSLNWQPEMVLDVNSITPLKVFEWQEYADLKMDVFNDQAQPVTCHVQVGDSHAYLFDHVEPLTPKKVTNISVPLEEITKNRLDLGNIRSFRFWVDTTGATQPVVVYLDNIRLEGDATAPRPTGPAATPTPHR